MEGLDEEMLFLRDQTDEVGMWPSPGDERGEDVSWTRHIKMIESASKES